MVFSLSPTKMWRNSPRMAGTTVVTLGSRVRCHGAGLERRVRSAQWSDRCFGLVGLLFPTADEANHSMGESHAPKAPWPRAEAWDCFNTLACRGWRARLLS